MTISCPKCSGKGEIALFDKLRTTLEAIQELKSPTISEIYRLIPDRRTVSVTAVNRRVERLMELGVIKRVANTQPPRYELVT